ncbi:putative LRR receptor-like serine threonine- kinase [Chlorella sorokiniana]|uniref:LRR receptor-like serine threonine-kinase n=1 Tax=Chlorella sorokiniana TaxID=3076 RepID=A0A2P6TC24_CHLSO|nr:putative LRR receptor-like serine threonine- kinase [Chlorella sorokiniana]|eukprot:PRW20176.1 putative LRR receptor-like serine threonine- kinase [Chlorella sorokiniana]
MQRRPKRAPGPAGGPSFDALPDELLLAVFQLVPQMTCKPILAVGLQSRGAIERVCNRWRRLALQLPTSLALSFRSTHDDPRGMNAEGVAAALHELLPHLACRRIAALTAGGDTATLAAPVPALLARALYPDLRSLHLDGASGAYFASFLPLCRRLEELMLNTDDDFRECAVDLQLLCSQLCGLSHPLRLLVLKTNRPDTQLLATIGRHVQPAALALHTRGLAAGMWLPQLRACSITIGDNEALSQLTSGLEAAQLPQLCSFVFHDARPAAERQASPPTLPALALLPALCKMECIGSMPRSTWCCPHLTSLLVTDAKRISTPADSAAQCTSLRQLELRGGCRFAGGRFPANLCSALSQLSSLALLAGDGSLTAHLQTSLPQDFSQLSSLRQLHITGVALKPPSVEAFRRLPGLTSLHLCNCRMGGLPDGPYLSNLRSLDLSGSNPQLASPIPFAATVARQLQALRIRWDAEPDDWWPDVQWKLRCFPGLKLLSLDLQLEDYTHPYIDVLRDLIRSELPSCWPDLDGYSLEYPEAANWPDLKH